MSISKFGIDFDGLRNVTAPEFTMNDTPEGIVNQIKDDAHRHSGGYLGIGILIVLFIYVYWVITTSYEESLRYSKFRAICICSCICSVVGIFMTNVGYIQNLYPSIFFMTISTLTAAWIWIKER